MRPVSRAASLAFAAACAVASAAGCASYQPSTLPEQARLERDVARLAVDVAAMPSTALRTHRFDPSDGFDMTEVAMLAVVNSPDLRALRADAGVTRAQAFSAGLLPDPQLSFSRETALHPGPGTSVAFTAGLTVDIAALLAHSAAKDAADAEGRKANLDLLWQEWQAVAKARLLFVKIGALARSNAVLADQCTALRRRLDDAQRAVDRGLVTRDAVAPLLAAYDDASRQEVDTERQGNQARHDLAALLGLDPDVELRLVGDSDVPALDEDRVRDALAVAPRRRPDLLALQAGFEAQDDRYRGAIRGQFPAITIGPTRARDTSFVDTQGFALGITLPLFNRNRGAIAIESATRDKLREDYQQRLDATAGDAHRLLAEQAILARQLAEIDASLPALAQAAERAGAAFQARNLDALALTSIEGALLARRLERVSVHEAMQEQAIALEALLGTQLDAPSNLSHGHSS